MQQRKIGPRSVSAIGLGGMPMSIEGRPDTERAVATIHAALDAGVTLIDTADAYHRDADEVGHNEELIAGALRSYGGDTSGVLVATKGGHLRPGDGSWTLNGRPEYLKEAAKASARRLGVDAIGLYQFHRPDPAVPYADSVGALRELLDEGVIQLAGISNATVEQIDQANEVLGGRLVSVQNQFSPTFFSSRRRARSLRRPGDRLPALVAAGWHRSDGVGGGESPGVPAPRRRPRRQPAAGHPGLGARPRPGRRPDPRLVAAGQHHRLRPSGGPGADQ